MNLKIQAGPKGEDFRRIGTVKVLTRPVVQRARVVAARPAWVETSGG